MVGAFGPKMLRVTAKYADWWNVSSTGVKAINVLSRSASAPAPMLAVIPEPCDGHGAVGVSAAPTLKEAERLARESNIANNTDDDFDFVGTPEQLVEQMRAFVELGMDYFMLDCSGFPDLTTLELLANEVLPALNA